MYRINNLFTVCLVVGTYCLLSSCQSGNGQTVGASKIVYDVTEGVHNMLRFHSEHFPHEPDTLKNVSSSLYYLCEIGNHENISANDSKLMDDSLQNYIIDTSYLVNPIANKSFFENLTKSLDQNSSIQELFPPQTLIYRISRSKTANSCDKDCRESSFDELNFILGKSDPKFQISIGLEYDFPSIQCCFDNQPDIFQKIKVGILNIHFDFPFSSLSYSLFVKQLNSLSEKHFSYLKALNHKSLSYIKIGVPLEPSELSSKDLSIYRAYVLEYTKSWSSKYNTNEAIIIDSFPDSVEIPVFGRKKYGNINPTLYLNDDFFRWYYDEISSPRQLATIIQTVGVVAENVLLDFDSGISKTKQLNALIKNFQSYKIPKNGSFNHPFFHVSKNFESLQMAKDFITELGQFPNQIYKVKRIYFKNTPRLEKSAETEIFWEFVVKENITVGCSSAIEGLNLTTTIDKIVDKCDFVFQKSPLLLLTWSVAIYSVDVQNLTVNLKDALYIRKEFLKRYPDGEIVLQPNVRDQKILTEESPGDKESLVNIYCNEEVQSVHSFNEIIATWSQINNFTVNLGSIIDGVQRGMWHRVKVAYIDTTATDFVVLVRRNVPEIIDGGIVFPFTYQCLPLTAAPQCSAINFETNLNVGTTFEMSFKNGSLPTSNELQNLLLYCFGRFSNVEIRTLQQELIDTLVGVFTTGFADAVRTQVEKTGKLQLFVETKEINSLHKLLNTFQTHAIAIPISIHLSLSGWELHSSEDSDQALLTLEKYFKKHPESSDMQFGLTIEKCFQEINENLTNITALRLLKYVKYIVCDLRYVLPTVNQYEMQVFLDTNLYVQQYIRSKLGLDVTFRLIFTSPLCRSRTFSTEKFLKFLYDVNQHSSIYKIKYYIGEAFKRADECDLSWWRVSDSRDLTNDAVYTELESEYFKRETIRHLKILPGQLKDYKLIIGLSIMSLFLIGITVAAVINYRRMRNKFLTKTEIYEFRKGIKISEYVDDLELNDIQKHEAEKQPYQENFEILKNNIELGKIVGRGNSGIVYKGTMGNIDIVAVKTPPENCSKQIFKTMLAEVKILCYIGLHPNVLRFIGAYTKEIEQGFIYIVTEFCENGSLEQYLRSRKVTTVDTHESSSEDESLIGYVRSDKFNQTVEIKDLCRFSYEIANGMGYLTRRKVVHGDLSARNVLLTGDFTCKIGDFGLSRKLYNKYKYIKQSDEELPWKWMAIESLKRMEFTTKSDVWSFGVTLWEIFTLCDVPYHGIGWSEDFSQKLENGLRLSKPPLSSEETYVKMLQCWNISPDKRPQFCTLSSYFYDTLEQNVEN